MIQRLAAILLAAFLALPAAAEPGPTILTIAGPAVTEPNRGPTDAFADPFFVFNEQSFETARAFDLATLQALPQARITAEVEDWPGPVTGEGPRLADVLAAAGVGGEAKITVIAIDGYAAELTPEERQATDWVLTHTANDTPLGLGGRGPLWLLRDTGGEAVPSDEQTPWVWATILILAE